MKGKIKTIAMDKNFGFITPEDGSKDIFFHGSSLEGIEFSTLKEGDEVMYDMEESDKGPRAVKVRMASEM